MPPPRHAVLGITLSGLLLGHAASSARAQADWADDPLNPDASQPCVQVTVQACPNPLAHGETCATVRNACPFRIAATLCFDARRCAMQTVPAGHEWRWSGHGTPLISSAAR